MPVIPPLKRFCVITGHYGSGKTNLSVNLALDLAEEHGAVSLVDLDIVNPYFRSSDYTGLLESHGVRVIAPTFAGTTLDVPSLSSAVYSVFEDDGVVIVDAGGDDVGATALGRFARDIGEVDHEMLYVVNRYRNLTTAPEDAAALLTEIEVASRLKATGVVNNSHLRDETTLETVTDSFEYGRATAALLGLPLRFTTVPATLFAHLPPPGRAGHIENAYPVTIHVRTPWEDVS